MTKSTIARATREVLLTVGALLGVVCLLATVAGAAFDVKPLIFRSGSMSPAIHTGALAISRTVDASSLERGDVVSVTNASGTRVTHRVVNLAEQGSTRQLTLKGDDNEVADAETYTVTRAEKVLFDIPLAGYVVDAAMSPAGIFVLGLYVAWMLTMAFRRPKGRRPDGDGPVDGKRRGGARRAERPRRSHAAAVRMTAAVAVGTTLIVAAPAVAAPWTDDVQVTGVAFSAHTLSAPASLTCSGGGVLSNLTYTWPNPDVRYQYVVTLENSSGTVVRTDIIANSGSTSTPQSMTYSFALLNGFVGVPATVTVRVRARLTAAPLWVSNTSRTATGKLVSIVVVGLASSCT